MPQAGVEYYDIETGVKLSESQILDFQYNPHQHPNPIKNPPLGKKDSSGLPLHLYGTPDENYGFCMLSANGLFGAAQVLGLRETQEDGIIYQLLDSTLSDLTDEELAQALKQSLENFQTNIKKANIGDGSGSTGVFYVQKDNKVFLMTIGDSPVYLIKRDEKSNAIISCKRLNTLHSPNQPDEVKRLSKSGAYSESVKKTNRIGGRYTNISRAIGDFELNQLGLSNKPDVFYFAIGSDPKIQTILIVCTDGLFKKTRKNDPFAEIGVERSANDLCKKPCNYKDEIIIAKLIQEQFAGQNAKISLGEKAGNIVKKSAPSGDNVTLAIEILKSDGKPGDKTEFKGVLDGHADRQVVNALLNPETGIAATFGKVVEEIKAIKTANLQSGRIKELQESQEQQTVFAQTAEGKKAEEGEKKTAEHKSGKTSFWARFFQCLQTPESSLETRNPSGNNLSTKSVGPPKNRYT